MVYKIIKHFVVKAEIDSECMYSKCSPLKSCDHVYHERRARIMRRRQTRHNKDQHFIVSQCLAYLPNPNSHQSGSLFCLSFSVFSRSVVSVNKDREKDEENGFGETI